MAKYAKALVAAVGAGTVAAQQALPGDAIWTNQYVAGALALLTIFGVYRVPNKV